MNAIRELVKSGQVQAGKILHLETIPIPFLRDAPLVQGQWLDRRLVELADWGALLQSKGYSFQEKDNVHPLALVHFIRNDGVEVDPAEIQILRQKVVRALAKFPGRTLQIDEQLFFHFESYSLWRGRKTKGDLRKCVKEGLVTASWNQWVSDHGGYGVAIVTGVSVGNLQCTVRASSYYSCPHDIDEQIRQREDMLESLRCWSFKHDRKENLIQEWKAAVDYCLVELYAFRQAVAFIQKSYFDGHQVVFPDVEKDLAEIITNAEKIVSSFDESFADAIELYEEIDLEALGSNAKQQVNRLIAYIVDMAKAEALDCLGDVQASVKIAERYL